MTLEELALAAGVAPRWLDVHGEWHAVGADTLRAVLAALGLGAGSAADIAESAALLQRRAGRLPALVTGTVGMPVRLPVSGRYRVWFEDGAAAEGVAEGGTMPAVDQVGYHRLEVAGHETVLAVAPVRAFTVSEAAPGQRPWALATQLYGLRREADGGLGDFWALEAFVGGAARRGAAGVAISPVHGQFSADPHRYSPYSPSSRVALNVLHAGVDVAPGPEEARLAGLEFVDWPAAARLRLEALHDAYRSATPALLEEFEQFRTQAGELLETHAVFEALHAHEFAADVGRWHWRTWAPGLRDPASAEVRAFADRHADAVTLHAFMQFMADRSLGAAHQAAKAAGMSIGLIADLAVGADSGGSHCWSRQAETLGGMGIGAPPDLMSRGGQSWGLAAFSPTGLRENGFRAFLEMLRHAMRHAGGVRIDHALGLARLWVVPDGAVAAEGAYLAFPVDDLLRLIALESVRHRSIVLGEDLGTIPEGFQEQLGNAGVMGMRVLWFEKKHGLFTDPRGWTRGAAAMTSTHDLPTVAAWWSGRDVAWRRALNLAGGAEQQAREEAERVLDRQALWSAFEHSGAATQGAPAIDDTDLVVDAAVRHMATAACDLVLLPIEDALGLREQPNLPGTMDEHPNWRRRLPGPASALLDAPAVVARLQSLDEGRSA